MINELLKDGDIYWTCALTSEAMNHNDTEPQIPWRCMLMKASAFRNKVCGIWKNDVPDEDPNATAYVKCEELYATEEEAIFAFKGLYAAWLICQEELLNNRKEWFKEFCTD